MKFGIDTIHSASQLRESLRAMESFQVAAHEKAERERRAAEVTIELNEEMKQQNALLREQVKQLEAAKTAAEKQAREERVWKWIMLIVALVSIAAAIVL